MAAEAPCCYYAFTIGISWICVSGPIYTPQTAINDRMSSFYFPGTLVGPYTEYSTYASLIDGSLFESAGENNHARAGYVPHGRKRVAYTRMGTGFACLGLFVFLGRKYPYQSVLTDSWLQKGFLNR